MAPIREVLKGSALARRRAIKKAEQPGATFTDKRRARIAREYQGSQLKPKPKPKLKPKLKPQVKSASTQTTSSGGGKRCVVNPKTGRAVIVGSETYKKLKRDGIL